jgi:nucleoside-diphosphate-sugar epimerase
MERWCLERAKSSGETRIVVLNPTCVFGPNGLAYTRLPVDLARQGQFCWINDGKGICNFTYVENVVDAMLAATASKEAHGQRFIVNDGAMSWREFLGPFVAPLGTEVPNYSVEAFKALPRTEPPFRFKELFSAAINAPEIRAVAKRNSLIRKLVASLGDGQKLRLSSSGQLELRENPANSRSAAKAAPPDWLLDLYSPAMSIFSAQRARDVLKWSPSMPYETARDKTVRWLRDAGYYVSHAA